MNCCKGLPAGHAVRRCSQAAVKPLPAAWPSTIRASAQPKQQYAQQTQADQVGQEYGQSAWQSTAGQVVDGPAHGRGQRQGKQEEHQHTPELPQQEHPGQGGEDQRDVPQRLVHSVPCASTA